MLPPSFTFAAAGQALIKKDLRPYLERGEGGDAVGLIRAADVSFTNFEGTIKGSFGGWPTKTKAFAASSAVVLDSLEAFGFNMVSLCNNHAFDLGPGGILSTLEEVERRPLLHAGIGANRAEASRVRVRQFGGVRVALAAIDFGPQADYAYAFDGSGDGAIPPRPGLNRQLVVRSGAHAEPDEGDMARHLALIREAALRADFVAVYAHSHHWEEEMERTPEWMRAYARRCIDAGANIFVGHGTPVVQGMEIYKERPIFYGLGNFIFHTVQPGRWLERVGTKAWESVVAHCHFRADGSLSEVVFHPIAVGGVGGEEDAAKAGYPSSAVGATDAAGVGNAVSTAGPASVPGAQRSPGMLDAAGVHGVPVESDVPDVYPPPVVPRPLSGDAARRIIERLDRLSHPFGVRMEITEDGLGVVRRTL